MNIQKDPFVDDHDENNTSYNLQQQYSQTRNQQNKECQYTQKGSFIEISPSSSKPFFSKNGGSPQGNITHLQSTSNFNISSNKTGITTSFSPQIQTFKFFQAGKDQQKFRKRAQLIEQKRSSSKLPQFNLHRKTTSQSSINNTNLKSLNFQSISTDCSAPHTYDDNAIFSKRNSEKIGAQAAIRNEPTFNSLKLCKLIEHQQSAIPLQSNMQVHRQPYQTYLSQAYITSSDIIPTTNICNIKSLSNQANNNYNNNSNIKYNNNKRHAVYNNNMNTVAHNNININNNKINFNNNNQGSSFNKYLINASLMTLNSQNPMHTLQNQQQQQQKLQTQLKQQQQTSSISVLSEDYLRECIQFLLGFEFGVPQENRETYKDFLLTLEENLIDTSSNCSYMRLFKQTEEQFLYVLQNLESRCIQLEESLARTENESATYKSHYSEKDKDLLILKRKNQELIRENASFQEDVTKWQREVQIFKERFHKSDQDQEEMKKLYDKGQFDLRKLDDYLKLTLSEKSDNEKQILILKSQIQKIAIKLNDELLFENKQQKTLLLQSEKEKQNLRDELDNAKKVIKNFLLSNVSTPLLQETLSVPTLTISELLKILLCQSGK